MKRSMLFGGVLVLFAWACTNIKNGGTGGTGDADTDTDTDTDTDADGDADTDADTEIKGPRLDIVVVGDPETDADWNDGFAGQTPRNFFIGIERVELLTSATDTEGAVIFDAGHNAYKEVDMLGETELASVRLLELPLGIYTHSRMKLASTRYTLDMVGHLGVGGLRTEAPGTIDIKAALSDTIIDGKARRMGWMGYTFNNPNPLFFAARTRQGTLPPLPEMGTGEVVQEDGETWVVTPLGENTTILPSLSGSYTATVTMQVQDCFRWEDTNAFPDYRVGKFDGENNGDHEPIQFFGPASVKVVVK